MYPGSNAQVAKRSAKVGVALTAIVGLVGCAEQAEDAAVPTEQGLATTDNGNAMINGMSLINGLGLWNGLDLTNGLNLANGLI